MIKSLTIISIAALSLILFAGGPPSRGTDKDQRLKTNNPNAGKQNKSKASKPVPWSSQGPKQPPKK